SRSLRPRASPRRTTRSRRRRSATAPTVLAANERLVLVRALGRGLRLRSHVGVVDVDVDVRGAFLLLLRLLLGRLLLLLLLRLLLLLLLLLLLPVAALTFGAADRLNLARVDAEVVEGALGDHPLRRQARLIAEVGLERRAGLRSHDAVDLALVEPVLLQLLLQLAGLLLVQRGQLELLRLFGGPGLHLLL